MEKITVRWSVKNNYPKITSIDVEAHIMSQQEWNELSQAEQMFIIEKAVQEDFEQKISFTIDDYGI